MSYDVANAPAAASQTKHTSAPPTGVAMSGNTFEVERFAPNAAPKEFDWGRLFAGDCTLIGGVLRVFDNGTARWDASVMSRDDGDDSWGSRFLFLDDHDVPLWQHGWIWSPTLHPTPIDWVSTNQIFFASYIFPSIAKVSMTFHC
jgi:hypothetical protein